MNSLGMTWLETLAVSALILYGLIRLFAEPLVKGMNWVERKVRGR